MNLKASLHFITQSAAPKKFAAAFTCAGLLLAASPLLAEDKVVATVNGHDVTQSQLEIAATQSKIDINAMTPQQNKLLIDALVNRQLVLNEAVKTGFDKKPDTIARVKALTDSYVAANYLATVAETFKSSEEEMKAYYDKNVVANTQKEYKARHILVKTEDEAKALLKEITGGAEFAKLAKEKSVDSGSAVKGGDLGWFTEQDMVPEFSKAVASLNKGDLAKAPVKSQFGWHVIILDDQRTVTPPEFSAVKDSINKVLIKVKLNEYLTELNAKAKIQLK